MMLPHGTVIAVVDGRHFELYRNGGDEAHPALSAQTAPKLDERDRGAGMHHHSSSSNPGGHLLDEDAHVAAAAVWLNGQAERGEIENLVIVAPPRALGEMRRHYGAGLRRVLLADLPKDLAGRSGADILAAVRGK